VLQIKPLVDGQVVCEPGGRTIPADYILWQGIHVCAVTRRDGRDHLARDLPAGFSAEWPFTVNLAERTVDGTAEETAWLWRPFLESLLAPKTGPVRFTREIFSEHKEVIIVNCFDFMYGHCLHKLLYAARHLQDNPDLGLIVLIPSLLRWLVPDGVAEIWTADLGLKQMLDYHPDLYERITAECARFQKIFLSKTNSFPNRFHLQDFTRTAVHDFTGEPPHLTFIWREDRPWLPEFWWRRLRKLRSRGILLAFQNRRIRRFFQEVRRAAPGVKCCVAGLGRNTSFPDWIEDLRVEKYSTETERATAQRYAQSRVVVGIHGSNMLLPSGLAGMTIELVPPGKWDCLPLDLLINEKDARLALFRYRFVPTNTSPATLAQIAVPMLNRFHDMAKVFAEEHAVPKPAQAGKRAGE
jgi:hypothetical protein